MEVHLCAILGLTRCSPQPYPKVMPSLRSDIGYLAWLFAFEAAGRHLGFTRAAEELGVTQAAVSKQIVALEAHLGRKLFHRRARGVELTVAGRELLDTTSYALGAIARTMRDLRDARDGPLTVALSIPLSQYWLMPRLSDFTARHSGIAIRIIAQDEPEKAPDADLQVVFAQADNALVTGAQRLFGASVVAMASQEFLEAHPLHTVSDVLRAPLIRHDAPDSSWLSWRDWAHHAGADTQSLRPTLSVSRYEDAVIAAQRHQGVALVWCIEGQPLPSEGGLRPVPGPAMAAPGAIYLVVRDRTRPGVEDLIAWLAEQAGERAPGIR